MICFPVRTQNGIELDCIFSILIIANYKPQFKSYRVFPPFTQCKKNRHGKDDIVSETKNLIYFLFYYFNTLNYYTPNFFYWHIPCSTGNNLQPLAENQGESKLYHINCGQESACSGAAEKRTIL